MDIILTHFHTDNIAEPIPTLLLIHPMFAGHILHVYHVPSPDLPLALQPNGDVEHDHIPPEAQLIVGLLQQPETRDFCDRHVIEREP